MADTLPNQKSEQTLAEAVLLECPMSSRAGEPYANSPWGVFVGSHGGTGATITEAMLNCLRCCSEHDEDDEDEDGPSAGIGEWWKIHTLNGDSPHEGRLLRDRFNELSIEHLGQPLWVGTWLPNEHPLSGQVWDARP